jgi:predicted phage baseplate assembly protein
MPAAGGIAPEPLEQVKLLAPHAFRAELQRAISAGDYAELVEKHFPERVQRASASLRWTGSWYEVVVAVDASGQSRADPDLLREIDRLLRRYRRAGHDLTVVPARQVPLDIAIEICVDNDYLRGHVKASLLDAFSSRRLADGSTGFFHADKLSFGDGVRLSRLVATAQAVAGVTSARVTRLQRLWEGANEELANGILPLSAGEVARLDNDPGFPENGRLELDLRGGR